MDVTAARGVSREASGLERMIFCFFDRAGWRTAPLRPRTLASIAFSRNRGQTGTSSFKMESNPPATEGSLNSRKKAERKARAQKNKADKKAATVVKLIENKQEREVGQLAT